MTKRILYGIGLLFIFLMVLGLVLNYLLPILGISNPLTSVPIVVSFWACVIIVAILNRKRIYHWLISFKKPSIPKSVYALILLPIMAVGGAELVNYLSSNILVMILMVMIVVVPIVCMFTKFIPKQYWSFAIWMMALSLILQVALISNSLWGADNILEYGCYRVTDMNGVYNSSPSITQYPTYYTSLAVTILPIMINKIFGIGGFWIFKIIFPILLSFLPVAVYETIKTQFSEKYAILSAFLTMSTYLFFTTMLTSEKQLVSMTLLSIFILAMVDNGIRRKALLLFTIGLGIIVSHYSTAGLFVILFGLTAIILQIVNILRLKLKHNEKDLVPSKRFWLAVVLVITCFGWYWLIGNGVVIRTFFGIGHYIAAGANVGANNAPISAQTSAMIKQNHVLYLIENGSNYMPYSLLIAYLFTQVLIGIGIIVALWQTYKKKVHIHPAFLCFAIIMIGLMALELVSARFTAFIGMDRIYPIVLLILCVFMIVGAEFVLRKKAMIFSVVILVVFFLMNTGFIQQIVGFPLKNAISISQNAEDFTVFTDKEVAGARWAVSQNMPIYYDDVAQFLFDYVAVTADKVASNEGNILLRNYGEYKVANDVSVGSLIYLRKFDIVHNKIPLGYLYPEVRDAQLVALDNLGDFSQVLRSGVVVYQNSDCRIIKTTVDYKGE
jgi:uncharacterized membrane protein